MNAPKRRCVYTSLIGDYEVLNEQPVAADSDIPFLCLTDSSTLQSASWQVRVVAPPFPLDPNRSQRDFKLRPHVHLPEFDQSLYIDNSVILTAPPEDIFDAYLKGEVFSLFRHSFRETVLDEFIEVARDGLDDPARIFEQLNHYSMEFDDVLQEKPFWGGLMLRDHGDARVRRMGEVWLAHVYRYSRRDQLSLNAAFRDAGLLPHALDIDNQKSWLHSWPHAQRPDPGKRTHSFAAYSPPRARFRVLERDLDEQRRRQAALEADNGATVAALAARIQELERERDGLDESGREKDRRLADAAAELSAQRAAHAARCAARLALAADLAKRPQRRKDPRRDALRLWPPRARAERKTLERERLRLVIACSGLFDPQWYGNQNPDLRGLDPLDHYLDRGGGEGRSPGPDFDGAWYLRAYPDVADSGMNPLLHYVMHGLDEGRLPKPPG